MWLSAVMAAAGILCTLPIYRKTRRTIDEIREEQIKWEIQRRRDKAAKGCWFITMLNKHLILDCRPATLKIEKYCQKLH